MNWTLIELLNWSRTLIESCFYRTELNNERLPETSSTFAERLFDKLLFSPFQFFRWKPVIATIWNHLWSAKGIFRHGQTELPPSGRRFEDEQSADYARMSGVQIDLIEQVVVCYESATVRHASLE